MDLHRGLHHRGGGGGGGGQAPDWGGRLQLVELLVEGLRVGKGGERGRKVVVDAWYAVVERSHRGRHLRGRGGGLRGTAWPEGEGRVWTSQLGVVGVGRES